jgi:hypothetical protein
MLCRLPMSGKDFGASDRPMLRMAAEQPTTHSAIPSATSVVFDLAGHSPCNVTRNGAG